MIGKIGVAVSGADSNRVYALVENENGGLFSSDDAGATWKLVNAGRNIRQRAFYYTHVFADPNNKDIVYVLNTSAFRSTDGGKTLANIGNGTHGDHHDLWIDPDDPKHVVLGNDGGGAVTYNVAAGAAHWSAQDFPTAQFYHVITTKHVPYHVCGAQQDNSTLCVPSTDGLGRRRRRRRPRSTPSVPTVGGGEPGYIAPDPKDPDVFFAGANNGIVPHAAQPPHRRAARGQPVSALVLGRDLERGRTSAGSGRIPIIFSPVDPNVLYTSSQHVWKTTNGGQTWDEDQRRPHPPRSEDDAGFGRADHARHEQPGDLRDGVLARRPARPTSTSSGRDRTTAWCTSRATAARPGRTSRRRTCRTSAASARSTRRRSTPARRTSR